VKISIPNFGFNRTAVPFKGIRVAGRDASIILLERCNGVHRESRSVASGAALAVESNLDGQRSKLSVSFPDCGTWEFSPGSEDECRRSYDALTRSLIYRRTPWGRIAAGVTAGLLLVVLLNPGSAPAVASGLAPSPMSFDVAPVVSSLPPPAPSGNNSSRMDIVELAQLSTLPGIAMGKGGAKFAVFSDPNCPYCRELERSLLKLNGDLTPVVHPLAFKDGSRELSAAVLCSTDPAKAWRKLLIEGIPPSNATCDKGYAQLDDNMKVFQDLRLSSTPTMISVGGSVVVGSGDPEKIKLVMAQ